MAKTTSIRKSLNLHRRLLTSSLVICIETEYDDLKWLRCQKHNKTIIVVESSSYGNPLKSGYSMIFDNVDQFVEWLDERTSQGWNVTFVGDTEPLDDKILEEAHSRILKLLKNEK